MYAVRERPPVCGNDGVVHESAKLPKLFLVIFNYMTIVRIDN